VLQDLPLKSEAELPHSKTAGLRRRALQALMHFGLKAEAFVE
jgi:hypothetical protein